MGSLSAKDLFITAWNISFDKLAVSQQLDNATFTAFLPVKDQECSFTLKVNFFNISRLFSNALSLLPPLNVSNFVFKILLPVLF